MSDNGAGGGQYVTYREHISAKEEAAKVMSAIQLEQAAQRAALMHLPDDVRRLTEAVNGLGNRLSAPQPAATDANALALHHAADALKRATEALAQRPSVTAEVLHAINAQKGGQSGGIGSMILIGLAMFAVGVACLWIGKVFF